ncbi:MAG: hypothetical protein ACI9R3_005010 [Verrucomicrobiales bacterium]
MIPKQKQELIWLRNTGNFDAFEQRRFPDIDGLWALAGTIPGDFDNDGRSSIIASNI